MTVDASMNVSQVFRQPEPNNSLSNPDVLTECLQNFQAAKLISLHI